MASSERTKVGRFCELFLQYYRGRIAVGPGWKAMNLAKREQRGGRGGDKKKKAIGK